MIYKYGLINSVGIRVKKNNVTRLWLKLLICYACLILAVVDINRVCRNLVCLCASVFVACPVFYCLCLTLIAFYIYDVIGNNCYRFILVRLFSYTNKSFFIGCFIYPCIVENVVAKELLCVALAKIE